MERIARIKGAGRYYIIEALKQAAMRCERLRMKRLRGWVPEELVRVIRDLSGKGICFLGDYESWDAAAERGSGYDDSVILDRVFEATLAVLEGRAAFERDGVQFASQDYPYPLIACLLRVVAIHGGSLSVVDVGGSLGGTYFQIRSWLEGLTRLRWCVVEQTHFVARGREYFSGIVLQFEESIHSCCATEVPNVAILSGIIQYLKDPEIVFREIEAQGIAHVIVDRTPIIGGNRDVISLQVVPDGIVRSSYPVRLFSRSGLVSLWEKSYRALAEFPAVDSPLGGLKQRVEFKGFFLEKLM